MSIPTLRIYYAAPLHKKEDQERNAIYTAKLREQGYAVYLPQEIGIWEDMVKKEMTSSGFTEEKAVKFVRSRLYLADKRAIDQCDAVVVYFGDRNPSEGGLWEMGYAVGKRKPVLLYNPHNWRFNLMPEFGSMMFSNWSSLMSELEDAVGGQIVGEMKGWFTK